MKAVILLLAFVGCRGFPTTCEEVSTAYAEHCDCADASDTTTVTVEDFSTTCGYLKVAYSSAEGVCCGADGSTAVDVLSPPAPPSAPTPAPTHGGSQYRSWNNEGTGYKCTTILLNMCDGSDQAWWWESELNETDCSAACDTNSNCAGYSYQSYDDMYEGSKWDFCCYLHPAGLSSEPWQGGSGCMEKIDFV
jgi:hypothetical protein